MLAVFLLLLLGLRLQGGGKTVLATTLPAALRSGNAPGLISGQVTGSAGQPLAGIQVSLRYVNEHWGVRTTLTAADGSYRFAILAPGLYQVEFTDLSYRYGFQFFPGQNVIKKAAVIAIAGNQRTDIDAQLRPAGTIAGAVRLPSAQDGFGGAGSGLITLYRPGAGYRWTVYGQLSTTEVGSRYHFGGLAPGVYHLCVEATTLDGRDISECYENQPFKVIDEAGNITYIGAEQSNAITVTAAMTTVIDLVLGNPVTTFGQVRGAVQTQGGERLSNILVNATLIDSDSVSVWGRTDARGEYQFAYLSPGSYRLAFYDEQRQYAPQFYHDAVATVAATPVTVTAGADIQGIDVTLQIGAIITGTALILGATAPDRGYVTALFTDQNGAIETPTAVIQPTGAYTLTGLASGTYRLCAHAVLDGAANFDTCYGGADSATATPISIMVGKHYPNLNFTFAADEFEAAISGIVTDTNGPLANIRVDLYDTSPGRWVYATVTDEQGQYHIEGLPNRTYQIRFVDPAGIYATTYYPHWQDPEPFVIHSGEQLTGINGAMTVGGTIRGTIYHRPGEPAPSVTVIPYRYSGSDWTFIVDNTTTDGDGHYTLQGLLPGQYRVESVRAIFPERDARFNGDGRIFGDAPIITVAAGQTVDQINIIFYANRVYLPLVNR